jgi:hypothetical protein
MTLHLYRYESLKHDITIDSTSKVLVLTKDVSFKENTSHC